MSLAIYYHFVSLPHLKACLLYPLYKSLSMFCARCCSQKRVIVIVIVIVGRFILRCPAQHCQLDVRHRPCLLLLLTPHNLHLRLIVVLHLYSSTLVMWPFSSKPSEASSASVTPLSPPLPTSPSVLPIPTSPPTLEPARAGPPGGLAAPSKPAVPVTKAGEELGSANVLQIPDSGGTFVRGLDTGSLLTVLAGVFISTTGPRFFGITNPSRRTFFVLGTWSLTSWALVIHLTQRFRDQELQNKWAAANSGPGTGPDFEGGVGGQEGLKDKYATTRGDH